MATTTKVHDARRAVGDLPPRRVLTLLGVLLAAVATVATFLIAPGYAVVPFTALLVVTGVGWVVDQGAVALALTGFATVLTVLTVALVSVYLFAAALPAFLAEGITLLTIPIEGGRARWFFFLDGVLPTSTEVWNPSGGAYSLIPTLWSTVVVTVIAAVVAVPAGILGALYLSDIAGDRTRAVVKPAVEVLAGIPSIVYGFLGFAVLNNVTRTELLGNGPTFLAAGAVVGLMALPTVISVSEDALSSVSADLRDASIAMGATRWQTMTSVTLPAAFSGISAAVILGLGRAIGETMAVAAIMAAGVNLADPLYDVFDSSASLTSLIATQYGSASLATEEVLFAAGVVLFTIVGTMSVAAQALERVVGIQGGEGV